MTVREAKAVTAAWIDEQSESQPSFRGAYVAGSAATMPDASPFPITSDIDIRIVVDAEVPNPIFEPENPFRPHKLSYRGLTLEPSFVPSSSLLDPATVLSDMHLAPAIASGCVLRDPQGVISAIHRRVASQYSRRKWVTARCDHALAEVLTICDAARASAPPRFDQRCWMVANTLAAALGTTWIPVVASLGNLTTRKAFIAARRVLSRYDLGEQVNRLLDLLGSSNTTSSQAEGFALEMTRAYDEAIRVGRTAFHLSYYVSMAARAIVIEGIHELLQDFPGESMFFLSFVRTIVQNILAIDAPEQAARHGSGYHSLTESLGLKDGSQVSARLDLVRSAAHDFRKAADRIIQQTAIE